ncbi:hypothetical protein GW17_00031923 [Ensete ventricosum]|nr:hypothetical protein GW17_00031923 [Ensete ventricosum]
MPVATATITPPIDLAFLDLRYNGYASPLMRSPSTPRQFWLPLLHDSVSKTDGLVLFSVGVQVKLLNWKARPLLSVSEMNLLLNKLQDLSMGKLCPDFVASDLPPNALSSIRLALATNLGRAILEEC